MFVIEAAIAKAADELSIDASDIQQKNLLKTGDEFPTGKKPTAKPMNAGIKQMNYMILNKLRSEVDALMQQNKLSKKGMALMPICFGISFTKTLMNQARALVHVYTDGSVSISTGAVEMGQGVNTKMLQVAAQYFPSDPEE